MPRLVKPTGIESRMVVGRAARRGKWEFFVCLLNKYRISFLQDENSFLLFTGHLIFFIEKYLFRFLPHLFIFVPFLFSNFIFYF